MTLTRLQKQTVISQAKATAYYMLHGINGRANPTWTRVCLVYKGSAAAPKGKGFDRLIKALTIHYDGTTFGTSDIGTHIEIACDSHVIAEKAKEYIDGWIAKG